MAVKYAKDGLTVLAVNAADEEAATLKRFVRKGKLKQRVLLKGGAVFVNDYFGESFPTSFWIDRKGVVVDLDVGTTGPGDLDRKTKRLVESK